MRNSLLELLPAGPLIVKSIPGLLRHRPELFDPISAITAAVGIGGSIFSGVNGSNAAKDAGNTLLGNSQQVAKMIEDARTAAVQGEGNAVVGANGQILNGTTNANATLENIFGQQAAGLLPYLQAGNTGIDLLSGSGLDYLKNAIAPGGALGGTFRAPTAEEAAATPGEQFAFSEGQKAIQRSAAATGGVLSGGTLKALDQYSQNLASQYYQQAYNNALNTFNTNRQAGLQNLTALSSYGGQLANLGQFGTSQFNTAASNYGNTAANNYLQSGILQGNNMLRSAEYQGDTTLRGTEAQANAMTQGAQASAAARVGSANAWTNAINGITGSIAGGLGAIPRASTPAASGGGYASDIYGGSTLGVPNAWWNMAPPPSVGTPSPNFNTPSFIGGASPAPAFTGPTYTPLAGYSAAAGGAY